ncbi:hypothetical protein [Saccharopolyspora hattusasensis]|uniref:hypothetical protein n=1 Tax=Saccharopolyspora hattusasensis TaxID=1128679 RepID=UPI003D979C33
MPIPHVTAGNVARASEQNALIDAVNTNTTNIASNTTAINGNTSTLNSYGTRITALESTDVGTDAGQYFGQWKDAGGNVVGTAISGSGAGAIGVKVADITTAIGTPVGCSMSAGTLTVTQAGLWMVLFSVQYTGSTSVRAAFAGTGNATNFTDGNTKYGTITGPSMDAQSGSAVLRLAANATVSIYAANWTASTTLNVWRAGATGLTAVWLGP